MRNQSGAHSGLVITGFDLKVQAMQLALASYTSMCGDEFYVDDALAGVGPVRASFDATSPVGGVRVESDPTGQWYDFDVEGSLIDSGVLPA